jgi:hypothetical protein
MVENNHQLEGHQTRGQIASLMHIPKKPDYSTSNRHNFRHATQNGLKPFFVGKLRF